MYPQLLSFSVLFLDADGVFFTGHETRSIVDGKVVISKTRWFPDGQGISFLRHMGIRIVFVSGEGDPLQSAVDKMNNLPSAQSGAWAKVEVFEKKLASGSKVATIKEWLSTNNLAASECVYMGDDLNDFDPMQFIKQNGGLIVAPSNATRVIRKLEPHLLTACGGNGAIREFAEMVIDARDLNESTFPPA